MRNLIPLSRLAKRELGEPLIVILFHNIYKNKLLFLKSSYVKGFVPGLTVDIGAVKQGGQEALGGTHTVQHQADPIQRGQQEEEESQQEAAMVGLTHTAVNPVQATMQVRIWIQLSLVIIVSCARYSRYSPHFFPPNLILTSSPPSYRWLHMMSNKTRYNTICQFRLFRLFLTHCNTLWGLSALFHIRAHRHQWLPIVAMIDRKERVCNSAH